MPAHDSVAYRICPVDPAAHLFEITLTLSQPQTGQHLVLPAWIPGSYMIREFARNIVWLRAAVDGQPVGIDKQDKHTWQLGAVPRGAQSLVVTYAVYAWDLSVRCAYLDATRGFFNGTQVFLRVEGRSHWPCTIYIAPPPAPFGEGWSVATALREHGKRGRGPHTGFGEYEAATYDELIDHPVEMGVLTRARFEVRGVPHEIVLSGRHDADLTRLSRDLPLVCEAQCAVFGDQPPPFARYVFLVNVVGEGYGGLEHRASTALLCARKDMPYPGMVEATEAYIGFLGLCSHEYFHAWNVKRIKPAAFVPYDLQQENYTRLLWLFEGFTSYYDDLALVRAGLITQQQYLDLLAKTVSAVARSGGRQLQTVAESSFDAWIKFYRQDENAPNAIVSYYQKGALVALALDLLLRERSGGTRSLDDVMRALWARFGDGREGLAEDALPELVEATTGLDVRLFLKQATASCDELPLARAFKSVGLRLDWKAENKSPSLGARLGSEGDWVKFVNVYTGGPAHAAGLSAGDLIVACDGLRVKAGGLEAVLARRKAGDSLKIHAFRRDELLTFEVRLAEAPASTASLSVMPRAGVGAVKGRQAWLRTG